MSRRLTELGGQEGLHEIPGHTLPCRAATDADDVHVVVFDTLRRRKMIMDQPGPDTGNLVRADRGPHTAAADGNTTLDRSCRYGLSERNDEIRIVVVRGQRVGAEIYDVVSRCAKSCTQILLQAEP